MYPPTPTPFPAGMPPVSVPLDDFHIWDFAPISINMWNSWLGPTGPLVAQVALIIAIVLIFCMVVYKWLNSISVDSGGSEFQ